MAPKDVAHDPREEPTDECLDPGSAVAGTHGDGRPEYRDEGSNRPVPQL